MDLVLWMDVLKSRGTMEDIYPKHIDRFVIGKMSLGLSQTYVLWLKMTSKEMAKSANFFTNFFWEAGSINFFYLRSLIMIWENLYDCKIFQILQTILLYFLTQIPVNYL